ncbi:acetyl esterase/lipase [Chryseobacterium ginsenosidimutans]|uniref:alpha/beta hydrolase n=1 Tax=Chryseobacterium ginsenosidimutans TaxID=687846 RepID=UPI00278567D8|nr:alpha/beta hydrolase [Chryseobacterium ginsenosidimutans]MDQ0591790.1 acetyl esterase/lipase [Chryseobacterium ginsenosidimutans]
MKNYILIFGSLILMAFSISCKENTIDLGKNISFKIEENISYGKDSEQKIDIYLPKRQTHAKNVFIIIHGGGWRGGKRSQLTSFTFDLMKRFPENIFVNVDYRLASSTRFALPSQTDDIKNVMIYLEKNLKINPKYILLGNSAGGNLSMLFAYKFDEDKKVKAVINIVGPADLNDPRFKNYDDYSFVEKHLIDPKIVDNKTSLMDFGSPVYWINKSSAPTLSYYGTKDNVVPLSQKKILDSILNKNKVHNESYEFNGNHLEWDKEPNSTFLINKIELFLKDLEKNNPSEIPRG